jgi:1,2-phenylacetyl-CoA epoxidase catalytic subunit
MRVLLFVILVASCIYGTHALKHSSADEVRRCMEQRGPEYVYHIGNRYYFLCRLDDGSWGLHIQVFDDIKREWREITAFKKSRYLDKCLDYFERIGAEVVVYELPVP